MIYFYLIIQFKLLVALKLETSIEFSGNLTFFLYIIMNILFTLKGNSVLITRFNTSSFFLHL